MYILCAVIYCGIGFCSFVISSRHWRPLVMTYRIILFCLLSISGEGFWHLLPAQWFVFHLFLLFFSCYFRWVICFFFPFSILLYFPSILSFPNFDVLEFLISVFPKATCITFIALSTRTATTSQKLGLWRHCVRN